MRNPRSAVAHLIPAACDQAKPEAKRHRMSRGCGRGREGSAKYKTCTCCNMLWVSSVLTDMRLLPRASSRFSTAACSAPCWPARYGGFRTELERLHPSIDGSAGTRHLEWRIAALAVTTRALESSHRYVWVPHAPLPQGLMVLAGWGSTCKTGLVWHRVRQDGRSDGRGVRFRSCSVTQALPFGISGQRPTNPRRRS